MKNIKKIRYFAFIHILAIGIVSSLLLFLLIFNILMLTAIFISVSFNFLLISFLPLIASISFLKNKLSFAYIAERFYPQLKKHYLILFEKTDLSDNWKKKIKDYIEKTEIRFFSQKLINVYVYLFGCIVILLLISIILAPFFMPMFYPCGAFLKTIPSCVYENDTLRISLVYYNIPKFLVFIHNNAFVKNKKLYIPPVKEREYYDIVLSSFRFNMHLKRKVAALSRIKYMVIKANPPKYTGLESFVVDKNDSIPSFSDIEITLFLSALADTVFSSYFSFSLKDKKAFAKMNVKETIKDTIKVKNVYGVYSYPVVLNIKKDAKPNIKIEYPLSPHNISSSMRQDIVFFVKDDYGIKQIKGFIVSPMKKIYKIDIPTDTNSIIIDFSPLFLMYNDTVRFYMSCTDNSPFRQTAYSDTILLIMPGIEDMVDAISNDITQKTEDTKQYVDELKRLSDRWAQLMEESDKTGNMDKQKTEELIKETKDAIQKLEQMKNILQNQIEQTKENEYLFQDKELMNKLETLNKLQENLKDLLDKLPQNTKSVSFNELKKNPMDWKENFKENIDMNIKLLEELEKGVYKERLKQEIEKSLENVSKALENRKEKRDSNTQEALNNLNKAMNISIKLQMQEIENELKKARENIQKSRKEKNETRQNQSLQRGKEHIEKANKKMKESIEDIKTPLLESFTILLAMTENTDIYDKDKWRYICDKTDMTINYFYEKGPADPMMFIMSFIKINSLRSENENIKSVLSNRQFGKLKREKDQMRNILSDIVYILMFSKSPSSQQGGGDAQQMMSMAQQQMMLMQMTKGASSQDMQQILSGEKNLLQQLEEMMQKSGNGEKLGDIGDKLKDLIEDMKGKDINDANVKREIIKKQRDITKHLLEAAKSRYDKGQKMEFVPQRGKSGEYGEYEDIMSDWKDKMIENYRKDIIESIEEYQRRLIEEWQY